MVSSGGTKSAVMKSATKALVESIASDRCPAMSRTVPPGREMYVVDTF